jgi:hypothetical protein
MLNHELFAAYCGFYKMRRGLKESRRPVSNQMTGANGDEPPVISG